MRGITNSSSGKMGFALAQAAAEAGAEVSLVAGPTALADAGWRRPHRRQSAAEMAEAVLAASIAATCSWRSRRSPTTRRRRRSEQKLKKTADRLTLTLKPRVDILATVAARPDAPFCVGFAAESHDVERLAEEKRKRKKLPLLIANRAQDALGSDANEVTLLDADGALRCPVWASCARAAAGRRNRATTCPR